MRLVYKFYIRHTEELDRLFRISNNLYNQALYLFRQQLDADGTWLWYNDMDKLMKKTTNLEGECNYKLLKSQCSQQVLRVLDKNIKAFCKSIKDWKKHPEKYKGMPKMPHYRKRGGMFNLYYTNQSCSIKDGRIRLAKDLLVAIPQWEKYGDNLKSVHQVRLLPNYRNIKVEIVYEKEIEQADVDKAKYASIDLGLDNLATMVTSEGCTIYSGKYLKSYNNHFNKTLSHLQSIKDLQGIKRTTRRITRMYDKRDRYLFYAAEPLTGDGRARGYGISVGAEQYMTHGLYWLINGAVYKNEYRDHNGLWHPTRMDRGWAVNAAAGKEWNVGRRGMLSVNIATTAMGGLRETPYDEPLSAALYAAGSPYVARDESRPMADRNDAVIDLSLNVSYRIHTRRIDHVIGLDYMNLLGQEEPVSPYYNYQTHRVQMVKDCYSIPNISYAIIF